MRLYDLASTRAGAQAVAQIDGVGRSSIGGGSLPAVRRPQPDAMIQ
ncbi:hypothetical protein ACPA9J_02290 [Pseudomonas aeruginosa]